MNTEKKTYNKASLKSWSKQSPLHHASGIWGRKALLARMRRRVKKGETIIDLGCGAGYVTHLLTRLVGSKGCVVGYDNTKVFIDFAQKLYEKHKNLKFELQDVNNTLPDSDQSVDRFVSFMLIQNLRGKEMNALFMEVSRCLRSEGEGVFLTLHPDIWKSPWDLDFIKYDKKKVSDWRQNKRDDLLMRGFVKNATGGRKSVFMLTHSRRQIENILHTHQLRIVEDAPVYIDQKTAERYFGKKRKRMYPKDPVFWIFAVRKNS